jgi:hypothetical protein
VTFTDATAVSGIAFKHFHGDRTTQLPEDMGSGAAWGDYDNDGDLDLYLVNEAGALTMTPAQRAASPARNALYRNNGDGTFSDVTDRAGTGYRGMGMAAAWGDYDNDGDLDLYVTNYGRNVLYRNAGDGTFADVSRPAGVDGGQDGFRTGATWGDYDRDGWLDLYVCQYVDYRRDQPHDTTSLQYSAVVPFTLNPSSYAPLPNLLYRNNGDGTFTETARRAGVDNPDGRSLAAVFCDLDNDGWPDLYVANDISESKLYWNRGDGRFEDASAVTWVADYRGSMGIAVGDWDHDGDLDLFKTHWIAQENAFYNNLTADLIERTRAAPGQVPGFLRFTDLADQYGLGEISLDMVGWGTGFFDYDNDGRQDLFVVNGSTFERPENTRLLVPQPNFLFWNRNATEGFYAVSGVSGPALARQNVGRGAAFGDYDGDGDVDIVVVENGGPAVLLRNDGGNRQHWLTVRLRGTQSNRFGVGSRVTVSTGGVRQVQEVGVGVSYLSFSSLEATFGLGPHGAADRVSVRWPSGLEQVMENVRADQTLTIVEEDAPASAVRAGQRLSGRGRSNP